MHFNTISKIIKISITASFILLSSYIYASDSYPIKENSYGNSLLYKYGNTKVQVLKGTNLEMGVEYGANLKNELNQVLNILKNFYIVQHGVSYNQILQKANTLYDRFPKEYQIFLNGVSEGSGLSIDDVKILNAMETYTQLVKQEPVKCAFLFIPKDKTITGGSLIGRNYDYIAPFNKLAMFLNVTILKQSNKIPTAFISIAGEAYCPSCVNSKGVFMELNNGTPSGGTSINVKTETMLAKMLQTLQDSSTMNDVLNQFKNTNSDYSLIVNTANDKSIDSFEFSSKMGMHNLIPDPNKPFASTNFYLDPSWGKSIPVPTDATTWDGVTRRNNLLKLSNSTPNISLASMEKLMNLDITKGGAAWPFTIYQLIFDESSLTLYVKINSQPEKWTPIPLKNLFNQ